MFFQLSIYFFAFDNQYSGVCVCVCVRACACVRACVRVCVFLMFIVCFETSMSSIHPWPFEISRNSHKMINRRI